MTKEIVEILHRTLRQNLKWFHLMMASKANLLEGHGNIFSIVAVKLNRFCSTHVSTTRMTGYAQVSGTPDIMGDVWVYAITVMYIPTASVVYTLMSVSGPVGNSSGGKSWQ